MTIMSKENYITNNSANCCPVINCQSDDVSGGHFSVDGHIAIQDVRCNICEATWQDEYRLTDFTMTSEAHENE